MNPKLTLILFVAFTVQLQAHQGIVLDANTGERIPGANVFIYGTTIGTSTNEDGIFNLSRFPAPPFQIHISMVGYETGVFEILEMPRYGILFFLLEPTMAELSETVIRGRRIRHPGCNANEPGFGWNLGIVDRGGERIITGRNFTQIWSDPVTASNCQKETFDGGSQTSFNADCRSNPSGFRGDFFSWCAVVRFAEVLCPYPWRVPTREDFMRLSNALCDNWEGSYFIPPHLTRCCHREFVMTWGGFHHGFSDPSGNVHERGRLVYYWEGFCPDRGGWEVFKPELEFNDQNMGISSGTETFSEEPIPFGLAVHNWSGLCSFRTWRVSALNNVHDKGQVAVHLKDCISFQFVEESRESRAVYYWSLTTHGTWQAFILGLSADRDPTYIPPLDRERNRDRLHRWGYYSVLPQLIIDKRFGLTLRCVR
jgi:hypothetical protein